jgi:hypothetical protein
VAERRQVVVKEQRPRPRRSRPPKLRRLMASYSVGLAGRIVAWCGARGMS